MRAWARLAAKTHPSLPMNRTPSGEKLKNSCSTLSSRPRSSEATCCRRVIVSSLLEPLITVATSSSTRATDMPDGRLVRVRHSSDPDNRADLEQSYDLATRARTVA